MKISVQVKTGARENHVVKITDINYKVSVKAPPVNGRANSMLLEVLADYFGCPKPKVIIITGLRSKKKIVEIL